MPAETNYSSSAHSSALHSLSYTLGAPARIHPCSLIKTPQSLREGAWTGTFEKGRKNSSQSLSCKTNVGTHFPHQHQVQNCIVQIQEWRWRVWREGQDEEWGGYFPDFAWAIEGASSAAARPDTTRLLHLRSTLLHSCMKYTFYLLNQNIQTTTKTLKFLCL